MIALVDVIRAQNHNPYFEVSNVHIGGSDYVFIPPGANDTPFRTAVTMSYRDNNIPSSGETQLSWESGDKIDVYEIGSTSVLDMSNPWKDTDQGDKSLELEAQRDAYEGDSQTLQATYTNPDGKSSPIGERAFTLVKLDLDIDTNGDDSIDNDDEATEATTGAFVLVNDDDDDKDGKKDKDQSGSVSDEDDLVVIQLSLDPDLDEGQVELSLTTTGDGDIKVWEDATKTTAVTLPKTWDLVSDTLPTSLYVEGTAESSNTGDVELTLKYQPDDTLIIEDSIVLTLLKVDIEVNDTSETNDDIVRKSIQIEDQNYRQWVPCKLKIDLSMVSALAPFTVSSAGSGVEFYKVPAGGEDPNNDTTPTSDITLVASDFSNDFAEFFVCGGGSASNSIGDIDINVTLDSASTPIFSKALTVYEFSNELLETVPGSPYSLLQNPANPSEYRLTSSLATWLIASSDINPVGLDYSAPQLSNHELSFSQVGRAVVIRILGNPQLIPGSQPPSLASGQYSSVIPDELKWEQVVSEFINDTIAEDDPLYILEGHNTDTNPVGLEQSSQPAVDVDTPSAGLTLPFPTGGFDARDSSTGVVFGKYHYTTIVEISLDYEFKTWAVVYDSSSDVAYPIKQNSWILDVNSNGTNNQTSSQVSSSDPALNPKKGAPYFNSELNAIANGSFSSNAGSHTLTVTVP